MRDPRVFHIDCSDWEQRYNDQGLRVFMPGLDVNDS